MVDRVSASITIGGTVSLSLWKSLAAAIAAEALSTDWDGEPFNDSDLTEGQPLRLFAHEVANGTFKELEPICEAHGVPFVRSSYGFTGQWGPEKVVFTGTGDPVIYPCSEDGTAYVDRAKIEALGSLAAVNAYLDEADFGVPPIVITDEIGEGASIVTPVALAQAVHVPPALEIARILVLGTIHMSPATAANWMPHCPWACFDKDDYGWFMHVCDDVGITEAEGVPAEIRSAIHVAKRENCAWIMWDCDGPQVDELPEYEWGDAPRTSP